MSAASETPKFKAQSIYSDFIYDYQDRLIIINSKIDRLISVLVQRSVVIVIFCLPWVYIIYSTATLHYNALFLNDGSLFQNGMRFLRAYMHYAVLLNELASHVIFTKFASNFNLPVF